MYTDLIMDDKLILILKDIQTKTEEIKKTNSNKKYKEAVNLYIPTQKRQVGVDSIPLFRQSYENYNSENTTENIINKIPYEPDEEETKL